MAMTKSDYRSLFAAETTSPPSFDNRDLDDLANLMSGLTTFPTKESSPKGIFGFLFRTLRQLVSFLKRLFGITPKPPDGAPIAGGMPAGYTYLAQFLTHEITNDGVSNRHVQKDLPFTEDPILLSTLVNLRRPTLDLETVYGYENPGPEQVDRNTLMDKGSDLWLLKLGYTGANSIEGGYSFPSDLPRDIKLVDERNDENLLISQTLVAFIKFHNALVVHYAATDGRPVDDGERKKLFDRARRSAIRHYQRIILTDFLPRIVQDPELLEEIIKAVGIQDHTKLTFKPAGKNDVFIPTEFSAAAFRLGHSILRTRYNVNRIKETTIVNLMFKDPPFIYTDPPIKLQTSWLLDWRLFYDFSDAEAAQAAEPIDTRLVRGSDTLMPKPPYKDPSGRSRSIAALDLYRGRKFSLESGQSVSKRFGIPKELELGADDIGNLIRKMPISDGTKPKEAQLFKNRLANAFDKETPLWFYILAEAEIRGKGKLGPLGTRIVAETLAQLAFFSDFSVFNSTWDPKEDLLLQKKEEIAGIPRFTMPEMFEFIQEMTKAHHGWLMPALKDGEAIKGPFEEISPYGRTN